jgi:ABC-type transport system substrate-binding protein
VLSGWKNERADQLLEEAKRTLDPARRKELYTEVWSIVNVELPQFQLHEVTQTSAAVKELKDYQPSAVGALSYHGGGLRTAYLET